MVFGNIVVTDPMALEIETKVEPIFAIAVTGQKIPLFSAA